MYRRLFSLFLGIGILASAAIASDRETPATHGMVIFGQSNIYASHLPMYHAPHDAQVILQIDLDSATQVALINDRNKHPGTLYTLSPTPFVLSDLKKGLNRLTATLYRGHFERGGIPIQASVPVIVKKVLWYQGLDRSAAKASVYRGIIFGEGRVNYMAHEIDGAPSFDQITELECNASISAIANTAKAIPLGNIPNDLLTLPATVTVPGFGTLGVKQQVYSEVEELKD
jgi:hypothetical protein